MDSMEGNHPFIILAPRRKCIKEKDMYNYSNIIIKEGGEGVMLRKPYSLYENGNSKSLLKFKNMIDGEALVTDIEQTKFEIYICLLPDRKKTTFAAKAKPSNKQNIKISVGDVVTYGAVPSKMNDILTMYEICKVRKDVTWEDILKSYTIRSKL